MSCRICDSSELEEILDMGEFSLSGVFPTKAFSSDQSGKLQLLLCQTCSLVQLSQTFLASEMYGDNYGYRSGLNNSMVQHLKGIASYSKLFVDLTGQDTVLDIGSNDGTLLRHFGKSLRRKIGIDPTAGKFLEFYDSSSEPIVGFFNREGFYSVSDSPAKVITSIAMLYDLENPREFVGELTECLDLEGVWISEQSYMPWMVLTGAYDTICHEHIEYYSVTSLEVLLRSCGMRLIDAELNEANGGSLRFAAVREASSKAENASVGKLKAWETSIGISDKGFYSNFSEFVGKHGMVLSNYLTELKRGGKVIGALGASTKGSILLQHAGLDSGVIDFTADVNPFKFGRYMPNSNLQIEEETEVLIESADVLLVLPWHFQETFKQRLSSFLGNGGTIIWPLPSIRVQSNLGIKDLISMPDVDFQNTPLRTTQVP